MSEMIQIDKMPSYLARPAGGVKAGVVLIHEVWGLTDHIKSVADRLACEGYLVAAPDLLAGSRVDIGKLSGLQEDLFNPEKRNETQPKLRRLMTPMSNPEFGRVTLAKVTACFDYLYSSADTKQKVAVLGYCFGGTYSYSLAVSEPRLALALPFYGHADLVVDELTRIKCRVRAFYGQNDNGLAHQMRKLPEKMKQAGVDFEQKIYSDCGHAFFNDTNRFAYNKAAASDSWNIVLKELSKI